MKKIYNKLVRDHIPTIILHSGKECSTHVLNEKEYQTALKEKLIEEAHEVNTSADKESLIKEIVDVLEVIDALKESYQLSDQDIQDIKESKKKTNGGFKDKILLEYVIEADYE